MMNDEVLKFLKERLDRIEMLHDRLDVKIDKLIAFRWQIIGGSIVASVILTFGINVIMLYVRKTI